MLRHPWYDWARSALILAVFSGCVTVSASRIDPPEPNHGTQYYSSRTAKLLGSDTSKALDYRMIDPGIYKKIVQDDFLPDLIVNPAIIRQLKTHSVRVTLDNCEIQTDLQWVRDSSMVNKVEYQIYLYIDTTGLISSAHGLPGTDSSSSPWYNYKPYTGVAHPVVDSQVRYDWILIGQVHGHPDRNKPGQTIAHHMSSPDSTTAQCLQIPVYAVDAMDKRLGRPEGCIGCFQILPLLPRTMTCISEAPGEMASRQKVSSI